MNPLARVSQGFKVFNNMVFGRNVPGWNWSLLPRTRVDYAKEVGDGTRSDLVMGNVHWLMRVFPEPPVSLLQRTGEEYEPIVDHPMIDLLNSPNDHYDGMMLLSGAIMSYAVDGNAYWIKIRSRGGEPVELWWVPHWMIEPAWDRQGNSFITHYVYTPRVEKIDLDPADVVHFRFGFDPMNPRKGLSPLKSIMRELFSDSEAANWTASLLRNGGVPGLVLSPATGAEVMSPADFQTTKEAIHARFGGDRRGEPLVIPAVTAVQTFGFSPEQMDLKNLRRLPEERVCAAMGIPPIIVGYGVGLEHATYSNYQTAERVVYRSNLVPTWRTFGSTIRRQLLSSFERDIRGYKVEYDTSEIEALQEDRTAYANRLLSEFRAGTITLEEIRAALHWPADQSHRYYLRPQTLLIVPAGTEMADQAERERQSEEAAAALQLQLAQQGQEDQEDEEEIERGTRARIKARIFKQGGATATALWEALDSDAQVLTAMMAADLEPAFEALGERIAQAWEKRNNLKERTSGVKLDPIDPSFIDDVIRDANLSVVETSEFLPVYQKQMMRTAIMTVDTINTTLGLGVNLPDPVAQKLLASGGSQLGLIDIQGQARKDLFSTLAAGRLQGEGAADLAARIRDQLPSGRYKNVQARAMVIARTETKWAQNKSSIAAYKGSEAITHVRVFDAQGAGETDSSCQTADGQIWTFDKADDEPLQHPNCTRNFSPHVARDAQGNLIPPDNLDDLPSVTSAPTSPSLPSPAAEPPLPPIPDGPARRGLNSDDFRAFEYSNRDHRNLPGYIAESADPSLYSYTGKGYEELNAAMRIGARLSDGNKEILNGLNKLMTPLPDDQLLFRGITGRVEFQKGSSYPINTPMSTTRSPVNAAGFSRNGTMLELHAPKGSRAIITNEIEQEIILQPGQSFRVIDVVDRQISVPLGTSDLIEVRRYVVGVIE